MDEFPELHHGYSVGRWKGHAVVDVTEFTDRHGSDRAEIP